MNAGDWAAIALWLSVACFVAAAFGVAVGKLAVSFVWLGVGLFVAGAYAIPAL